VARLPSASIAMPVVIILSLLLGTGSQSADARAEPKVNPHGYTSATVCGSCHEDIYATWKRSLHAMSIQDPIFRSEYMQALLEYGDEARRRCLSCHAPMTMANDDYALNEEVTREGVACDFCHTVAGVQPEGSKKPFILEPGLVKRSVLENASSPAHEVAYSKLHTSAKFCGGCHNYTAPGGARIMSTYQEWLEGPYSREGVQCQDCHMVVRRGNIVRPSLKGAPASAHGAFHVHDLIHDTHQLQKALEIRIVRAERIGTNLAVDVEVENVGSGHMIPTGVPSREVVATVEARVGKRVYRQERRYRKVVADAQLHVLDRDYEMFLRGARVLNDNRIGPRETRHERFTFFVPSSGRIEVRATASYVYTPMILKRELLKIQLGTAQRVVY
jgi:hypothetical protein